MGQKSITIEKIGKQEAVQTNGLIALLMRIFNECHEISGIIGYFSETEIISMLSSGKILVINRMGTADKIKIIGVAVATEENRANETGSFLIAFNKGVEKELMTESLKALKSYAYESKAHTLISIKLAKQGTLETVEGLISFLGESGFKPEFFMQKALKTPDGFIPAWICSAALNGRTFEPIAFGLTTEHIPVDTLTSLNSEVGELKTALQEKISEEEKYKTTIADLSEQIENLKKSLQEENTKHLQAKSELLLLKEKMEKLSSNNKTTTPNDQQQKITKLEKELLEQTNLLKKAQEEIKTHKKWLDVKNEIIQEKEIKIQQMEKTIGSLMEQIRVLNEEREKKKDQDDQNKTTQSSTEEAKIHKLDTSEISPEDLPAILSGLGDNDKKVLEILANEASGQIAQRKLEKLTDYPQQTISYICNKLEDLKLTRTHKKGRGNTIILMANSQQILQLLSGIETVKIQQQDADKDKINLYLQEKPENKQILDLLIEKFGNSDELEHVGMLFNLTDALVFIKKHSEGITKEDLMAELNCKSPTALSVVSLLEKFQLVFVETKTKDSVEQRMIKPREIRVIENSTIDQNTISAADIPVDQEKKSIEPGNEIIQQKQGDEPLREKNKTFKQPITAIDETKFLVEKTLNLFHERIEQETTKTDNTLENRKVVEIAEKIIQLFLNSQWTTFRLKEMTNRDLRGEYDISLVKQAVKLLEKANMAILDKDEYHITSNVNNRVSDCSSKEKTTVPNIDTSEFGIVVSRLREIGPKGINGNTFCKELSTSGIISYDSAKTVLYNLNRKKMLKIVMEANTPNKIMDSIIALKN